MNVLDEFKNYKREFIQISSRIAILLHIFEKEGDDFEDIILLNNEGYKKETYNLKLYKDAADQFFKQFEGNDCIYFIKCLKDKCDEIIKKHEEKNKEIAQKLTKNKEL